MARPTALRTAGLSVLCLLAAPAFAWVDDSYCGPYDPMVAAVAAQYGMVLEDRRLTGIEGVHREIWRNRETGHILILAVKAEGEACIEAADPAIAPLVMPK